MFADAVAQAQKFTFPVLASSRHWNGDVKAGAAAFVVLNTDGWIATAAHIFQTGLQAERDAPEVAALQAKIAAVRADATLRPGFADREVKKLHGTANREWITRHSYWWARDGVTIRDISTLVDADLAIGRLDPVPSDMVAKCPTIKNPSVNMDAGRSLCRLGFPFSQPKVSYDETKDAFELDANWSFFPLDGIFTRTVRTGANTPGGTPISYVETSSAGLRGQSGGPVFDVQGRIWGIQSKTIHIPLGFNPEIEVGGRKVTEHQFINLGWAVHSETLTAVLNELGVGHKLSTD